MKKTIPTIVMAMLCLITTAKAQETIKPPPLKNQAIIGKVVSASTGETLSGAVIKVTSTIQTTVSNDKGEFILNLANGTYNLSLHYLSYKTKTITIQIPLKEKLIIALDNDEQNLQEVEINAGYYTVKDKERTGSITRVTAETIEKQPVSNVLGALIGRMAGVNIEQQSGINGGGFKVEIRGQNSLRNTSNDNGNQPLFLIDGIPYPSSPLTNSNLSIGNYSNASSPLNYINPTDIESIEVLKDADATAIYGSRGANGVVLIRTKTAKTGKTSFDFNLSSGISKVSSKIKLLNTEQYTAMRVEAFANDEATPGLTAYDLNGTWDKNRYTDWQDVLIGGTAHNTNLNASINGGNQYTQFSARANYSRQTTVTPGDFADLKGSASLTSNHLSLNNKFKASFSMTYGLDHNTLPRFDLTQYIFLAPNAPALYNANGNLNWAYSTAGGSSWTNPMVASKQPYDSNTNVFISNGTLNYEILNGLSLRSSLGYTNIRLTENHLIPFSSQLPSPTVTGSNMNSFSTIDTWILEPQINYQKTTLSGIFDVLFGSTFQQDKQRLETINGLGYTNDLLLKNINSSPIRTGSGSSSEYKYNALFGRINYNHKEKYIVNITGRRDGSSRFGSGKQFANFGALGLVWIFTNEQFIKNEFSFLSFGKLRGSYGITGSDQIPNYGYLETYSALTPYRDGSALSPVGLANPDYSWEINKKLEVAAEFGLLKEKFWFSTNWYRNISSNQLVGYPLPDITGFPIIQYNLPATVRNTGWEFEFNSINTTTSVFSWKTGLNLTIPRNKLLSYPNITGSSYANIYTVGESLFTPRVYHISGVDPETGHYIFDDPNRNGTMEIADRKPANKSLTNHLYGGIQNNFKYKNVELDIFFQFTKRTSRYAFGVLSTPGGIMNQPIEVLDRWQVKGDITSVQKFSTASPASSRFFNTHFSDLFTDASFIRLKNISLSWNIPDKMLRILKLSRFRIFVIGQNVFTLTKHPGDPEGFDLKTLPSLTTINAGIQIGL